MVLDFIMNSNNITLQELAKLLGRSYSRVYTLIIIQKRIPAIKEGKRWYVSISDAEKFALLPRLWGRKRLSDLS